MFINAVYMCQMIGPCIFTDYTLDVAGYLIFVTGPAKMNHLSVNYT